MTRFLQAFLFLILLTACAGPTSPFGPLPLVEDNNAPPQSLEALSQDEVQLEIYPDKQVLHDRHNLEFILKAKRPIDPNFELMIFYNHHNVTSNLTKKAFTTYHHDNTEMRIVLKNLRLPARNTHDIQVIYKGPNDELIFTELQPPTCSLKEDIGIANTARFAPPAEYIDWIQQTALSRGLSPRLMAGLIAQESAFNPHAVSWAKAIGLTQMTRPAAREIASVHGQWPTVQDIDRMTVTRLKALIEQGTINEHNEWRLDPQASIEGGATYLNWLEEYWMRSDKMNLLNQIEGEVNFVRTQAILASYNSGPMRVSTAIQEFGSNWLQAPFLHEARLYVNRVMSYCYHFSVEPRGEDR